MPSVCIRVTLKTATPKGRPPKRMLSDGGQTWSRIVSDKEAGENGMESGTLPEEQR